jgi:hypothetical protein
MRPLPRPLAGPVALAVLAGTLGACSDGPPSSDDSASSSASDDRTWERVVPAGDCQCSDGSAYNLWTREADPEKVVLYLEDGGACFSAATCDPHRGLYHTAITENPENEGGIFDFDDPRNPLADWSVVYAPYCTGDVFLGDATTEYAPDLTIHHNGYRNGSAALDELVSRFPEATEILVVGESAGSVAAPFYAGLAADRLPGADVVALADGSGSYPNDPRIEAHTAGNWGTAATRPEWPETTGAAARDWGSFPGLFVQAGRHDPDIVFARHDYAYDANQAMWYPLVGIPAGDLLSRMDANEAYVEAAGVDLASYIAPGDGHTALTEDELYTENVEGVALVDWLRGLVAGEAVGDVRCTNCGAG